MKKPLIEAFLLLGFGFLGGFAEFGLDLVDDMFPDDDDSGDDGCGDTCDCVCFEFHCFFLLIDQCVLRAMAVIVPSIMIRCQSVVPATQKMDSIR